MEIKSVTKNKKEEQTKRQNLVLIHKNRISTPLKLDIYPGTSTTGVRLTTVPSHVQYLVKQCKE